MEIRPEENVLMENIMEKTEMKTEAKEESFTDRINARIEKAVREFSSEIDGYLDDIGMINGKWSELLKNDFVCNEEVERKVKGYLEDNETDFFYSVQEEAFSPHNLSAMPSLFDIAEIIEAALL
jgi:hypothetical protein